MNHVNNSAQGWEPKTFFYTDLDSYTTFSLAISSQKNQLFNHFIINVLLQKSEL